MLLLQFHVEMWLMLMFTYTEIRRVDEEREQISDEARGTNTFFAFCYVG